jgi:hypothetical protein
MKKPVLILSAIVALFVAVTFYHFAVGFAHGFMDAASHDGSPAARERRLATISADLNKQLPKDVNPETVMVTTKAGPGLRFTYVVQYTKKSRSDIDAAKFAAELKPKVIEHYRNMPQYRKWEIELCYQYLDKDTNEITTVSVSPKDL